MKIVAFNVPTQGHINPTLPVVKELVQRGVEVVYYLTPGQRERIEATGATFKPYENLPDDYFEAHALDGSNPPRTARVMIQTSRELLPWLLAEVQREKPDVILHDAMCPWGWLTARKTQLPSAASMSTLMLTPPLILKSGQLPTMIRLGLKNWRLLQQFTSIAADIGRTYHIRPPSFTDALSGTGTITLNYTSKLLQPGAESLDPSIKFIGPSIVPRLDKTDFPLAKLDYPIRKALIYISLGTVINDNTEFYRACLQVFATVDAQVVMSVGQKIEIGSLGEIPPNFIVRNFVPQLDILQRASLFITHSGLNSVHEGLYYNVPLLLVPQQAEQGFTASRIQELGAGINLAKATPTAAELLSAAERILSDSHYRERAHFVGQSLRTAGGYKRAADEIMALKGKMIAAKTGQG